MRKRKATSQLTNDALPPPTFNGATFLFSNQMSNAHQYSTAVFREGGRVVFEVSKKLTYLVVDQVTSQTRLEKQVHKLNQAGATIQVLSRADFLALMAPTRAAGLAFLRGGGQGLQRWYALAVADIPMPDLSASDFQGIDFAGQAGHWLPWGNAKLDGANFRGANLHACHLPVLQDVVLERADFSGAFVRDLKHCRAASANLAGATVGAMSNTDFTAATLEGVKVSYAGQNLRIQGCTFKNARLVNAELRGCHFIDANFSGADLTGACLQDCKFSTCNMTGVKLVHANLASARFDRTNLSQADFTGAFLLDADFSSAKTDGTIFNGTFVRGARISSMSAHDKTSQRLPAPSMLQLDALTTKGSLEIQAMLDLGERVVALQLYGSPHSRECRFSFHPDAFRFSLHWQPGLDGRPISTQMNFLAHKFARGRLRLDSIAVKAQGVPLPGRELKSLCQQAWCEAFGRDSPSADDVTKDKQATRDRQSKERDSLLADLLQGQAGVKRWNSKTLAERKAAGNYRRVDFSGARLQGVDFSRLDFQHARFDRADLAEAWLYESHLQHCCFQHADLRGASCRGVRGQDSDFSGAKLNKCDLEFAYLRRAVFAGANLRGASLMCADLCGADLREAKLHGVDVKFAKFDESTCFPKGFHLDESMKWEGTGRDPRLPKISTVHDRKRIGWKAFMNRVQANVDAPKLTKALEMLRSDRFQLYAEVADQYLVGVVKSQTDTDLVYACWLGADGTYACCTQNFHPCGGMRGSVCKHILVLAIGLGRSRELNLSKAANWLAASRGEKPSLDKDAMSETFLRFKGAEAGEVDWRPTETIPEDYYAM